MSTRTQDSDFKVGELAKRTGLTVRTLHHYDEIGLLRPSTRTRAGHRLYGAADVARLQKISSLRQLGFSLSEIAEVVDGDSGSMAIVLTRQVEFMRERISAEHRLLQRLESILAQVEGGDPPSTEHLLETIALTTMFEKYYTQEQLNELEARAGAVGEERMTAAQDEWRSLHEAMDDARIRGVAPDSPEVQALARKAMDLIGEFTGGDAEISKSLENMVQAERPAMHELWGISQELGDYYTQAMSPLRTS